MELNEDMMWDAVIQCDPDYDGQFFYAVKTTGIVCRPSCKSKNPLRENVRFYPNLFLAVERGYRPCKRCRPDLVGPPSEVRAIYAAKAHIEQEYTASLPLAELAKRVGMSMYHFQRLFKKTLGVSPSVYLGKIRIEKSIQLLEGTDWSITKIAQEVGFENAAYFSVLFANEMACSPSTYRKRNSE